MEKKGFKIKSEIILNSEILNIRSQFPYGTKYCEFASFLEIEISILQNMKFHTTYRIYQKISKTRNGLTI